jgi:hypothetical protein
LVWESIDDWKAVEKNRRSVPKLMADGKEERGAKRLTNRLKGLVDVHLPLSTLTLCLAGLSSKGRKIATAQRALLGVVSRSGKASPTKGLFGAKQAFQISIGTRRAIKEKREEKGHSHVHMPS